MFRFVSHKEIDKTQWDQCLDQCPWARIYAYSWYLDQVHPQWNALIFGAYHAIVPLPTRKKYGITYLAQPPFCQQLGLYAREEIWKEGAFSFFEALPRSIRWGHYQLNSHNVPSQPKNHKQAFVIKNRSNYELSLAAPYERLQKAYSANTRRNIRKAQKNQLFLSLSLDPHLLIHLKQQNEQVPISGESYRNLQGIIEMGIQKGKGTSVGVWDSSQKELLAGAFLLQGPFHLVYLLAVSSERGKEMRAMFYLVDQVISQFSTGSCNLDFEGSDLPGLARFYEGFGATNHPYPQVHLQRIPQWIVNTKNLIFPKK